MTAPASAPAVFRKKLAKVLALLASDQAGERDAAGQAASRMVSQAGLTWQQVMNPPAIEKALPELGVWRKTVAELLQHRGSLRTWEIGFLTDLPGFRRVSTKQRYVLKEIASRVLQRGAP